VELPRVVFFGRTGEEACRFFNLDLKQWQGKQVLDCASGPGSFTALARDAGIEVLAVDPLYALPEEELEWRSRKDVAFTIEHLVRSATPRP
jgi:ubiquinone/menaquinone biosynthesis C-methylase UbiE